uniref:Uncharacterized protein n=1 Tax=Heterorhabditis bacteriophora TaxID=37862 RepID=A0A1I7WUY9_HETBA
MWVSSTFMLTLIKFCAYLVVIIRTIMFSKKSIYETVDNNIKFALAKWAIIIPNL